MVKVDIFHPIFTNSLIRIRWPLIFGQLTATVDSHFSGWITAKSAKLSSDVTHFTEGLFQAAGLV